MIESTDFNFLYPWWLAALPVIWIIGFNYSKRRSNASSWLEFCDSQLFNLMTSQKSVASGNRQTILMTLILSLGVIALAGPSWQLQKYPAMEAASARVVVVDLSLSMLVRDIHPDRISYAKKIIESILADNYEGETGLVVFAGAAFRVAPLTRDHRTLIEFMKALNPETMPVDGSRLDIALKRAGKLLSGAISGTGTIIVVSDGIESAEKSAATAKQLAEIGNHLLIIPVGSEQGGPLVDKQGNLTRDQQGKVILAKTPRVPFAQIAEAGNGRIIEPGALSKSPLALLESETNSGASQAQLIDGDFLTIADNGGILLVWLMLPLALILFRKNGLWIILVTLTIPFSPESHAFDLSSFFLNNEQKAQQSFNQHNYDKTIELTENNLLKGSAYYFSGDMQAALDTFSSANNPDALYNKGNTLVQLERYQEALDAFRQALALDNTLHAAKINIELVTGYLQALPGSDADATNSDASSEATEESSSESSNSRLGQSDGSEGSNLSSIEAGIGASLLSENVRVGEEETQAAELALQLFLRQLQQQQFNADPEIIKLWASKHNTDPSDFFTRKFLRDHRRNQSQGR